MRVQARAQRIPAPPDLASGNHSAPHVVERGRALNLKHVGDVVGRKQILPSERMLIRRGGFCLRGAHRGTASATAILSLAPAFTTARSTARRGVPRPPKEGNPATQTGP